MIIENYCFAKERDSNLAGKEGWGVRTGNLFSRHPMPADDCTCLMASRGLHDGWGEYVVWIFICFNSFWTLSEGCYTF